MEYHPSTASTAHVQSYSGWRGLEHRPVLVRIPTVTPTFFMSVDRSLDFRHHPHRNTRWTKPEQHCISEMNQKMVLYPNTRTPQSF